MDSSKTKFTEKLNSANEFNAANALITREQYEVKLQHLLDLQSNNSIKKTQQDYRLINKCDVLNVTIEGITVKKLVKKGSLLRFVCKEVCSFSPKLLLIIHNSRTCSTSYSGCIWKMAIAVSE
jgi:hypothetical protein